MIKTLLTALLPVEHVHDDRDVAATKVNIHLWTLVLAWTLMLFWCDIFALELHLLTLLHFQYDIFALIRVTSLAWLLLLFQYIWYLGFSQYLSKVHGVWSWFQG